MASVEAYKRVKDSLPESVELVAVSKTKPIDDIKVLYDQGQRIFGENRVQELTEKYESMPKDIQWHMIGHLQRNKVKYIAPFVSLVHSIDSPRLLKEVNKEAKKSDRIIPVLLQFHIAGEDTKFGLDLDEARELLDSESFAEMSNIRIDGVMGMATFTDNQDQVRREFKTLKQIFDTLSESHFKDSIHFKHVSMGMSGDYNIAIEEGSTMIRVGSLLFGNR